MNNLTKLAAAVLLSAAAAPAFAQGAPGAHFIENWDGDGDGQVTKAEAAAKRADIFVMFDQNEDGVLDATEYALFDETRQADMEANGGGGQGPMKSVNEAMVKAFNDANGDGLVSREEFDAATEVFFTRIDTNGDGVVTTDDFGRRG